jgi:hypothetical protein
MAGEAGKPGEAPVVMVDRLTVLPGCQREVIARIERDYRPLADERGIRHVGTWVFPPFERAGDSSEIIVQWEYASLPDFWVARGPEESDARLDAFWAALDPLLGGRTRQLGRPAGALDPVAPPPPHEIRPGGPRGVALVEPRGGAADWAARIEALGARGGVNDGGFTFRPGELTVDFAGHQPPALDSLGTVAELVLLAPAIELGFGDPDIAGGVKRTILLKTRADATPAAVALLERRLCEWGLILPETINWSVSRVASSRGGVAWTHCFEQEFADVADVTGAYLNHPGHWAIADRYFHREAPEQTADTFFHSIYPITRSVLAEVSGAFAR